MGAIINRRVFVSFPFSMAIDEKGGELIPKHVKGPDWVPFPTAKFAVFGQIHEMFNVQVSCVVGLHCMLLFASSL